MNPQEKSETLKEHEKEPGLSYNEEAATLLLDIYPDQKTFSWLKTRAAKEGLFEKNEFHVTVIGRETGEIILAKLDELAPEEKERALKDINRLSSQFTWSFSQKPEYYYISKDYPSGEDTSETEERKSYIQITDLPDLTEFYKELNSMLGLSLEIPFSHITLFTTSTLEKNKLRGIGIYSESQFKNLNPQKIDPDRGGSEGFEL
ncbi:MAG: hypothetical protein Q7S12_02740 [bacterium]|nr:hypothetical protein [bacterium]